MEYKPSQTMAYLAGKVDEYVKFQGRDTIKRNAKRDRNCRYARIPDGGACDFCRMLGSRGFVYHTEESAGGVNHGTKFDTYHPYCNCQIAVCFDPFVEEYYVGWTKVTRGYGDGQVTVTGRDKSDVLRQVDIDELYDEYRKMAKDFNKGGKASKYKDYTKAAKLSDEDFDEAVKRLSDAKTLDELYDVAKEIERQWPDEGNGRDKAQWEEMKRHAKALERQLRESEVTHPLRMTGKETYSYYSSDDERIRDWMRSVTMVPQKMYSGPNIANKTRADMQTADDVAILEQLLRQASDHKLIEYGKPIELFLNDPNEGRDLFVHAALVRDKRSVNVLEEIQQQGRKNIDTEIDGERVEIKCPISDGSSEHPMRFVKDNFYTAVEQFRKDPDADENEVRILFCTRYCPIDDERIIEELEKFADKDYVASIEVLKKDGTFFRVK